MSKLRLDELMLKNGLAADLAEARALIMAHRVSGGGRLLDKPGLLVDSSEELHLKTQAR